MKTRKSVKMLTAAAFLTVAVSVLAAAPAKALAAFSAADTAKVSINLNLRSGMTTK